MGKITSTSVVRDSDPEAADLGDAAKFLGPARIVLDRCAEGLPGAEVEAADMAQRIVAVGLQTAPRPRSARYHPDRSAVPVLVAGLQPVTEP